MSRERRRIRSRASLVVLTVLAGCAAPGTDFEASPFYRQDRLLQVRKDPDPEKVGTPESPDRNATEPAVKTKIPPLLIRDTRDEDRTRVRLNLPFPFVEYSRNRDDSKFLATPIVPLFAAGLPPLRAVFGMGPAYRKGGLGIYSLDHDEDTLDEGDDETDRDTGAFPLFAYGHDKDEGTYLTLAPFGGKTLGLFGKDDMHWWGFPYPLYLYTRDNDFESRHVLWPFINWVNGEGRSGFRVWPFYANYTRHDDEGKLAYDRTWLLWPLLTWQTNGANLMKEGPDGELVPEDPTRVFAFLPFYGHVHGPRIHETDILWPLFRWTTYPKVGDQREEGWELRAPFPFVIIGHYDEGETRYDFWPFFGIRRRPGYVRHFALWPFERYELIDDDWVKDRNFAIFPFWQDHEHLDRRTGRSYRRWQLWPFVHYRREEDGSKEWNALSIFPFRNELLEDLLLPFVTLWRHREIPGLKSSETSLLFGLAGWRNAQPPGDEEYDRVSLLFGLFQYRRKGSERALRFLWLPEWPVWGTDEGDR